MREREKIAWAASTDSRGIKARFLGLNCCARSKQISRRKCNRRGVQITVRFRGARFHGIDVQFNAVQNV